MTLLRKWLWHIGASLPGQVAAKRITRSVLFAVLGITLLGSGLTQVAAQDNNRSASPNAIGTSSKELVGEAVWDDLAGSASRSSLTSEPTSDVLVAVTQDAAPGDLGSPEGRAAMRAAIDAIVLSLPKDEVRVTYRFAGARGFRAELTRAGLESLLGTGAVARVEDATRLVKVQDAAVDSLIAADQTRQDGFRGDGVNIAFIDSGINAGHPDLVGAVDTDVCIARTARCEQQLNEHGTSVALVAAGRGVVGPVGVAPGARIHSIRVTNGAGEAEIGSIIQGLDYVLRELPEVEVVNVSMSSAELADADHVPIYYAGICNKAEDLERQSGDFGYHLLGFDIVSALGARGTLVVASSGNGSDREGMGFPACISDVISVGAAAFEGDYDDWACPDDVPNGPSCYTNFNAATDVFAPGSVNTSDFNGTGTKTNVGTSFSTPLVAGCVASALGVRSGVAASQMQALLRSSPKRLVGFEDHARLDCADLVTRVKAGNLPEAVRSGAQCYERALAPLATVEMNIDEAVGGRYELVVTADYGAKRWQKTRDIAAGSSGQISLSGRRSGVEHRIVVRRDGEAIFDEVRKFSECQPAPPENPREIEVTPSCYAHNGKKYVQLGIRLFDLEYTTNTGVSLRTVGSRPNGGSWPVIERNVVGTFGNIGVIKIMARPEGYVFKVRAESRKSQTVGPVWCGRTVEVEFGACYTVGQRSYRNVQTTLRNKSEKARTFTAIVGTVERNVELNGGQLGSVVVSGRPAGLEQVIRVSTKNRVLFDESVQVPAC